MAAAGMDREPHARDPSGASDAGSERADEALEIALAGVLEAEPGPARERLEALCRERPDWEPELRRRWRALEDLGLIETPHSTRAMPERLGDFDLIEPLGQGGMGLVFRARQRSLGREVALKIVRPEFLLFPGTIERFRREADAIAKLSHPSIVPIHAYGEEQGLPYFAMEWVRGLSLAELLASVAGRAPESLSGEQLAEALAARGVSATKEAQLRFRWPWWRLILTWGREIAAALEHAHQAGIVHRDIKPSNLLIGGDGRARLADFGLTSSMDEERITQSGSRPGTLPYMSPEQLRELPLDGRSDLYSLGVTLYEALSLRLPFTAPTARQLDASIEARAERPGLHLGGLPRAAQELILVALEADRSNRYASAQAFEEDLGRALEGRPILARPPGPMRRLTALVARHKTASAALLSSVLFAIGTPTALYLQSRAHAGRLAQSLAQENAARASAEAGLADAETSLTFLCNLVLEAAPERLKGQPFSLTGLLNTGLEGAYHLAERPGVHARFLLCLGDVYLSLSDLKHAETALGQALEIERRTSGRESAWSLRTLNSLATALERQGRVQESLPLFEEALAGQLRRVGEWDLATAAAHNNLAGALIAAGETQRAIAEFDAAASIYARVDPPEPLFLATARANLAYAWMRAGNTERASQAIEAAAAELQRVPDLAQLAGAKAKNLLGSVWLDLGQPERSIALLETACSAFEAELPGPDLFWAAARFNLGCARLAHGDLEPARLELQAAEAQMQHLGLGQSPDAERYRAKLAECIARLGAGTADAPR